MVCALSVSVEYGLLEQFLQLLALRAVMKALQLDLLTVKDLPKACPIQQHQVTITGIRELLVHNSK